MSVARRKKPKEAKQCRNQAAFQCTLENCLCKFHLYVYLYVHTRTHTHTCAHMCTRTDTHTHTHAQKYWENTHDIDLFGWYVGKAWKGSTYMYPGFHEASWKGTVTPRDTLAVSHGHFPFLQVPHMIDQCHGWSWGFAVVPSIFSNRLKYCKVTLPSTVASPHFLDCVSSSAYTSIKTLFRDPVLGTHTVSIYKFDPPRRNNSCRTLDVLSCTIEYAIYDISYRMMPKRWTCINDYIPVPDTHMHEERVAKQCQQKKTPTRINHRLCNINNCESVSPPFPFSPCPPSRRVSSPSFSGFLFTDFVHPSRASSHPFLGLHYTLQMLFSFVISWMRFQCSKDCGHDPYNLLVLSGKVMETVNW